MLYKYNNEIKYVSRLDFTGIVNNTHLMQYTNKEILFRGSEVSGEIFC